VNRGSTPLDLREAGFHGKVPGLLPGLISDHF